MKHIFLMIVFLMGAILSYSNYTQHSEVSLGIELATENNSASNCFDTDSEAYEDDQITNKFEYLAVVEIRHQVSPFHAACLLSRPFFIVWQPPKIG